MLEKLREEHRAIERLLRILQVAAGNMEGLRRPELVVRAVSLIQEYAEGYHQDLEENVIFPRLEKEGVPRHGGPLEVLQAEHRLAKRYAEDMQSYFEAWKTGDETSGQNLLETVQAYALLMRAHIGKEDMVVLPMIQHAFQGERANELDHALEKASHHQNPTFDLEEYHQLLAELEGEYGLTWGEEKEEPREITADRLAEEFLRRES